MPFLSLLMMTSAKLFHLFFIVNHLLLFVFVYRHPTILQYVLKNSLPLSAPFQILLMLNFLRFATVQDLTLHLVHLVMNILVIHQDTAILLIVSFQRFLISIRSRALDLHFVLQIMSLHRDVTNLHKMEA